MIHIATKQLQHLLCKLKTKHIRLYTLNNNLYASYDDGTSFDVSDTCVHLVLLRDVDTTNNVDAVVNYTQLRRLITAITHDTVCLGMLDTCLVLRYANKQLRLLNHVDNVPTPAVYDVPLSTSCIVINVDTKLFQSACKRVLFAVAKRDTRAYLNYIYIDVVSDDVCRLVASDGRRLIYVDIPADTLQAPADKPTYTSFFLNPDVLASVANLTDTHTDIHINTISTICTSDTTIISSYRSRYPDYIAVIPTDLKTRHKFLLHDKKTLLRDIRLLKSLATDPNCTLTADPATNVCNIRLIDDSASFDVSCDVTTHTELSFNVHYLYDHINNTTASDIVTIYNRDASHGIATPASDQMLVTQPILVNK